jgi:tRNA-dihydrouridine synthase B
MDRAVEHLGGPRAGRYLRQFYPWYVERLGADKAVRRALQQTASVEEAKALLNGFSEVPRAA